MKLILRYKIPDCDVITNVRGRPIRWIEVEGNEDGWFVFTFSDIEAPPLGDTWFPSRREACEACEEHWGITDDMWEVVEGGEAK